MTRPFASVALLAFALAMSAGNASAQSIHTSKGLRTLPLTVGYKRESQYVAAARTAEGIAQELLGDASVTDTALGAMTGDVAGFGERAKREKAEYERAETSFTASNKKYLGELAAYQQSQAALAAEVGQQREQAAALKTQTGNSNYAAELARLNDWARQLANRRAELESERQRLLKEQERIEAERIRLHERRLQVEAKLKGGRDQITQAASATQQQRAEVYRQLRIVVEYLHRVRSESSVLSGRPAGRSAILEQAETRLQRYEKERAAK